MAPSEFKWLLAVCGIWGTLILLVLLSGRLPLKRPLNFARVFVLNLVGFSILLVPLAVWRLPSSYSSTVRIQMTDFPAGRSIGEKERIMSLELLRPVIEELSVGKLWGEPFSSLPLNQTDAHQLLTRAMKVEQNADARAFDLTVYGENASYPALFTTRIAAEYVAQSAKLTPPVHVRVLGEATRMRLPELSNLVRNSAIGLGVSAVTSLGLSLCWAALRAISHRAVP